MRAWCVVCAAAVLLAVAGCSSAAAPNNTAGSISATTSVAATAAAGSGQASEAPEPSQQASPSGVLTHPAPGSAERKAILDGLRVSVQRDLGQKVIFEVKHLNVQSGFAFVQAIPRRPSGAPIDYAKTRYRADLEDGVLDGAPDVPVIALLQSSKGRWQVLAFVVGPTDVAWDGWWSKYGAPKAIFDTSD